MEWQVVAEVDQYRLIAEKPDATPNPSVEIECVLPDGTAIKTVWSYLPVNKIAKLVTVHYFDRD